MQYLLVVLSGFFFLLEVSVIVILKTRVIVVLVAEVEVANI